MASGHARLGPHRRGAPHRRSVWRGREGNIPRPESGLIFSVGISMDSPVGVKRGQPAADALRWDGVGVPTAVVGVGQQPIDDVGVVIGVVQPRGRVAIGCRPPLIGPVCPFRRRIFQFELEKIAHRFVGRLRESLGGDVVASEALHLSGEHRRNVEYVERIHIAR